MLTLSGPPLQLLNLAEQGPQSGCEVAWHLIGGVLPFFGQSEKAGAVTTQTIHIMSPSSHLKCVSLTLTWWGGNSLHVAPHPPSYKQHIVTLDRVNK